MANLQAIISASGTVVRITAISEMVRDHNGGHRDQQGNTLPPYLVSIEAKVGGGLCWARPLGWPEVRKAVAEWCRKNCKGDVYIGQKATVHFNEAEDAILFYMSTK